MDYKRKTRKHACTKVAMLLCLFSLLAALFIIAQESENFIQRASTISSSAGSAQSESYVLIECTGGEGVPAGESESESYQNTGGYIPESSDIDGDGVLDEFDNCPLSYNPDQDDGDTDGVGNVCDNCPDHENPGQEDADGDGVGDVCERGSISGHVAADCPEANTGLLGVSVDAYELGTGDLAGGDVTDENGYYELLDLIVGDYAVTVVTPLGYSSTSDEIPATVTAKDTVVVDFPLSCVDIIAHPRSIGFWKHQVGVALGGKGKAQIDSVMLCGHLDQIVLHFNCNAMNQVIVYEPPVPGDCTDKLNVAKDLLNLKGKAAMIARARQQLMALLLNVAAGNISQTEIVSGDGATVSQAITYSDYLIDDPEGDHETAKTICDDINNNRQVAAGIIPPDTPNIAYKLAVESYSLAQNYPNPFNPQTTIEYTLVEDVRVRIEVYNVLGQLVEVLADAEQEAGYHRIVWNGSRLSSGVYFYRIVAGQFTAIRSMVLLK